MKWIGERTNKRHRILICIFTTYLNKWISKKSFQNSSSRLLFMMWRYKTIQTKKKNHFLFYFYRSIPFQQNDKIHAQCSLYLVQLWSTTNANANKIEFINCWITCGREITCCDSYLITFDSIQKWFARLMPIYCVLRCSWSIHGMWYEQCPLSTWTAIIMNSSLVAGWTCLTETVSLVCCRLYVPTTCYIKDKN